MTDKLRPMKRAKNPVGPLKGLKILDLSRLVAGNYLSFHLAELGAEVIKIEAPGNGDPLRHFTHNGVGHNWAVYARNKQSLALNLKTPAGRKIILTLVQRADALIENFKPGGLEKLGLSPKILQAQNSKLVIMRISGWGQSGPYAHKPGFGTLIEAFSGFAAKSGFPDSPPLLPNLGLADMVAGTLGAYSLLAALREVEVNGGNGQVVDLSLLESMTSLLGADPGVAQTTGEPIARCGNASQTAAPRNLYKTKDQQYLALSASMQSMAEKLFVAIGRADMISDPRFRSNADRVTNHKALDDCIGEFIVQKTLAENLAFFEARGITAGPVHDALSLLQDEHIKAREVFVIDEFNPDLKLPVPNTVPRFSVTPGGIHSASPKLGEHSEQILTSLGCDAEYIAQCKHDGVIL